MLSQAPILRIDHILVRGNNRMTNGEVLSVLGGLRGENIALADLNEWRSRLLASPWIKDASFRRSLPSTVEVTVSEREPIGIGRVKERLYLVDDRGAIIDEYGPQYVGLDLPIIDGLAPAKDANGVDAERGELAARLILSLRAKPAIAKRVSQVDVSRPHNAAVLINDDPAVIYVGEDRFLARIESYLGLAAALRARVADIDYVDLRFDDRIFVRPLSKSKSKAASGRPRAQRAGVGRG
jgi:cell division protein FtsQ